MFRLAAEEAAFAAASLRQWLSANWRSARTPILVNGSPKTGTTWMVRLLASLPGYRAVGRYQSDPDRYRASAPGDVVHDHAWYTPEFWEILTASGIKTVVMVRDPRDQTISRMYHVRRVESHPWHSRLKGKDDAAALMACIEGRPGLPSAMDMIELTRSWLNSGADILPVRYEELLDEPEKQFAEVLRYAGLQASAGLIAAVVLRNRFERLTVGRRIWQSARRPGEEDPQSHFRKGVKGDWRNHFGPDHVRRFKEVAGEGLIELGYETDSSWLEDPAFAEVHK